MRLSIIYLIAGGMLFLAEMSQAEEQITHKVSAETGVNLLRKYCWECHSAQKVEGELKLDSRDNLLKGGSSGKVVDEQQPLKSELLRRISLPAGHAEVMPARGKLLSRQEQQQLIEWVKAGTPWPENVVYQHWAYQVPQKPNIPQLKNAGWCQNPIDYYVLEKLEELGLSPAKPAPREILIRRVYLDITGLPPAPAEVKAFLVDNSPEAYIKVVDKLLAAPQFGEKWARSWLDAARYADSHGYQRDDMRNLWPYRDWVIKAFNADMPFDQFTLEQLAGDQISHPTEAQMIATGFNRCCMTNVEAGTDPEENRTNQVLDRVNTLGAVWLGTTLECCQCHNHKYDPFTMKDYYQLYAFFNNTAIEADRSNINVPGSIRFLGPELSLKSSDELEQQKRVLTQEMEKINAEINERKKTLRQDLVKYANEIKPESNSEAVVLKFSSYLSQEGATPVLNNDGSILFTDEVPDSDTYTLEFKSPLQDIAGFKLETLTDPSLPGEGPGRGDEKRPNFVLNEFELTHKHGEQAVESIKLTNAKADFSQKNFPAEQAIDRNLKTAWAINPQFHQPHWATFEVEKKLNIKEGETLTFTLKQNFGGGRVIGKLRITAYLHRMPENSNLSTEITDILKNPEWEKDAGQVEKLLQYRLKLDEQGSKLNKQVEVLKTRLRELPVVKTLYMKEMNEPRTSYIFQRGIFSDHGESVIPEFPAVLSSGEQKAGATEMRSRVDLARWLTSRNNPLTARVTVNRLWSEIFGQGIVTTIEDFGIKGELPSHPRLLDYLAVEFMEPSFNNVEESSSKPKAWSIKHLLRLIVTSATYQQSSDITYELLEQDDKNTWLARGPRFRMDAEMIRDNALAMSGLLSLKQFGEPIKPYQPEGLWTKIGGEKLDYIVSPGSEKHRRGIYVVWKRSALYPSFVNFDATPRLACTIKRSRSNTPLQALTLLNDPVYVECAKALVQRIIKEADSTSLDDRLIYGFRLCTARMPDKDESTILRTLYEEQLAANQSQKSRVRTLLKDEDIPAGITNLEFAAWYAVATALMNLDETITKR